MTIINKIANAFGNIRTIKISEFVYLPEFQTMFKLDEKEVETIAENMRNVGFDKSHSVHVWRHEGKYVVIDGHTRIAAATKAGLSEVPAILHDFSSIDEALLYAYEQQTNRRNLSDAELLSTIEKMDQLKKTGKQNDDAPKGRSNEILADKLGISPRQVSKYRTVIKKGSESLKKEIKSGEKSINQAYNEINGIESNGTKETINNSASSCEFCSSDGKCLKFKGIQR